MLMLLVSGATALMPLVSPDAAMQFYASTGVRNMRNHAHMARSVHSPRARDLHMSERIVVTGVGVVSAVGSGDDFWPALLQAKSSGCEREAAASSSRQETPRKAGTCGIDTIKGFDASKFPTTIGAECSDFDAKQWFDNPKNIKATDR
eukprot:6185048-Pleurochrysis_carterae.AAC.2